MILILKMGSYPHQQVQHLAIYLSLERAHSHSSKNQAAYHGIKEGAVVILISYFHERKKIRCFLLTSVYRLLIHENYGSSTSEVLLAQFSLLFEEMTQLSLNLLLLKTIRINNTNSALLSIQKITKLDWNNFMKLLLHPLLALNF